MNEHSFEWAPSIGESGVCGTPHAKMFLCHPIGLYMGFGSTISILVH
jgi:hypothetical protein